MMASMVGLPCATNTDCDQAGEQGLVCCRSSLPGAFSFCDTEPHCRSQGLQYESRSKLTPGTLALVGIGVLAVYLVWTRGL